MKAIIFTLCLFTICSKGITQTEQWWWHDRHDSTAVNGVDIIANDDGSFWLLGVRLPFFPPYPPGVPIDGLGVLDNIVMLLDNDFKIRYEKGMENFGVRQIIPASFFKKSPSGKIVLPFVKMDPLLMPVRCSLGGLRETWRLGLITLEERAGEVIKQETLYNTDGFCENILINGAYTEEDSLLIIFHDDYTTFPNPIEYTFQWVAYDGTPLSMARQILNPQTHWDVIPRLKNLVHPMPDRNFAMLGHGYDQNAQVNYLIVSSHGEIHSKKMQTLPDFETPVSMLQTPDGGFVVAANGIWPRAMIKLDNAFNEIQRIILNGTFDLIDFDILPTGGYVVLLNRRGQLRGFTVEFRDENGIPRASKDYGGDYEWGSRIVSTGQDGFAVVGTRQILWNHSDWGNPYARIFVLRDQIDNLDPVNTNEAATTPLNCTIYPNPAAEEAFVEFPDGFGKIQHGVLHDMQGRVLQYDLSTAIEGKINLSGLAPGVYILSFTNTRGHRAIGKLVKG